MECKCDSMEVRVTGWRTDSYFAEMPSVDSSKDAWSHILTCPVCHQYWLVDEFDKVQSLSAVKIDNPEKPDEQELLEIHIRALKEKYGGESNALCQFAGCSRHAVKQKAFCAHCLVTKQGVYE